jgi:fermentation-respiration switch protein FrsA (DUF1100 family)
MKVRDSRERLIAYSILIIVTLSSCGVKDKLTFFPDTTSAIPEKDIPSYTTEHWIETSDGETIQSFLFLHNKNRKSPLIIYFHGNAGNLYHRFDNVVRLFDMDHDVLLVSYRGYSKSTGKPNEKGIYIDGTSAVNYATQSLGYKEDKISIFGRSLGSAVAIHISQHRNFKNLILITPLTSGKEMASAMGLGFLKFVAGDSYNSLEKINNIHSRVLIIHGDRDEVVPYQMGERLFQVYNGDKHMVTISGGRHNDLAEVDPMMFWGEIEKFLQ